MTVTPLPSFVLSSESSESLASSVTIPIFNPRDAVLQDVPFSGWAAKHYSRYQSLEAVKCEICTAKRRRKYWSIVLLACCAKAGCDRCTLRLLGIFKITQRDRIGPDLVYTQVQFKDSIIRVRYLRGAHDIEKQVVRTPFFPWDTQKINIELYASPDSPALGWEPIFGVGRDVMPYREKTYTGLVMKWLQACLNEHPLCGQPLHALPPLVLDVGTSGSKSIRLCRSLGKQAPCVAISYCYNNWWRTPRTTWENLRDHIVGMPFDSLPPLFQDAVLVFEI